MAVVGLIPIKLHIMRRLTVSIVEPGNGTLQDAYDAASAGDTLELKDGTYTGSGPNLLEIAKDITIRAQNQGMAVLDGENARRVVGISDATVVLEGLAITKGQVSALSSELAHTLYPIPCWMILR